MPTAVGLSLPGTTMSPYLLADDLSGALESGAAFRAHGWSVSLPLTNETAPFSRGNLEVVSTETRNAATLEAAAIIRRLVAARRATGAPLLFKKIDSTLRGPIAAELNALITELAPPLVVICPANPLEGRTVIRGIVRVNGVPLEQTAFSGDPVWPATSGDLRARLAVQGLVVHAHIGLEVIAGGAPAIARYISNTVEEHADTVVLTSDALTFFDLRALVEGALTTEPASVLVGSGALGRVIAEHLPTPAPAAAPAVVTSGPLVVLCGSRHPASHRQIEILVRDCGALELITHPHDPMPPLIDRIVAAIDERRPVAVRCKPTRLGVGSEAIPLWLAEVAVALLAKRRPGVLYLTGGETAFAVCRHLGGARLEVLRELAPGVVLSELIFPSRPALQIISKPGGFGDPRSLAEVCVEIMK